MSGARGRFEVAEIVVRGSSGTRAAGCDGVVVDDAGPHASQIRWRVPSLDGVGDAESIALRLRGAGPIEGETYLRNGFQSWSYSGNAVAKGPGRRAPIEQMAASLFNFAKIPDGVDAVGESEQFVALPGLVAGFAELRRSTGTIFLNPDGMEAVLSVKGGAVEEGDELEPFLILEPAPGQEADALDEFLAEAAAVNGARAGMRHMSGWCSWYHYFHGITEAATLANLADAARRLAGSLDLFQLDDGYQAAIGDWLEPNEKFPSGVGRLAEQIASEGFTPGIWLAPFIAGESSRLAREHPDWLLRGVDGSPVLGMAQADWGGACWSLDTSHPGVQEWLCETARALREMGYLYLKLDFTYAVFGFSFGGVRAEPVTGAEALRLGLDAIRRGAGEDAIILGCGMPLWPAIGRVDAMRIGPDVAPWWNPEFDVEGIGDVMPATANAYRNTVARARMHRRLWVNDPDCVMLRTSETKMSPEHARAWADLCADSGQLLLISDDLSLLGESEIAYWRELVARCEAADVEAGGQPWAARSLFEAAAADMSPHEAS